MLSTYARDSWLLRSLLSLALCLAASCTGAVEDPSLPAGQEELQGVFHTYVVDHEDGSSREAYELELDSGEHVELVFAAPPELRSGERVSLFGRRIAHEQALSARDDLRLGDARFAVARALRDDSTLDGSEQALLRPPAITVRAAVVLLNFRGMPAQDYTAADARSDLARVRDYYHEMSYGSWTMDSDVFGPYQVTAPSQCNLNTLAELGKQAARAHGVEIDRYDHVAVKIAGIPGLNCPCGVAYLGGTPAQGAMRNGKVSLYTCPGANTFAHEMGHGIGLFHSSSAPCHGMAYRPGLEGCDVVEYGNRYNTMGNGLGHFNVMQKATLGWLNGCNIRRVNTSGVFELTAVQDAAHRSVTQGLQIDTGDSRAGRPLYFYVEYRNPELAEFNAGERNGTRRERGPGLHVTVSRDFRERQGEGRTILLDASRGLQGFLGNGAGEDGDPRMLVGDIFRPNRRVTIEFLSRTELVARVKVSIAGGAGGSNECEASER